MVRLRPPEDLPEDPRDLYVTTRLSLRDVAKRYGWYERRLEKRCKREKWPDLRADYQRKRDNRTQDKLVEMASDRTVKTLAQLNDEHVSRTQRLIQTNLAILDRYGETLSPSDLRRLTQNIIDLQEAERLYHNHNPRAPVEEKQHDDSRDDTVLLDLFSDLLEDPESG